MKRTIERINAQCGLVKYCVWPGCNKDLWLERIGPLCAGHADLIHEAIELSDFRYRDVVEGVRAERMVQVEADIRTAQAERQNRRDHAGWIYYIRIGERIKIGFATNYLARIRAYPPGSTLLAVHPGTPGLEQDLHQRLAASRAAAREWYNPTAEIFAHIEQVIADFGEPPRQPARAKGPGSRGGVRVLRG